MIEGTQPSQELMEKNLVLTQEDWMNILADWSGSQKDTECGIRTRIHTDVGSVTLSSSVSNYECQIWIKLTLPQNKE